MPENDKTNVDLAEEIERLRQKNGDLEKAARVYQVGLQYAKMSREILMTLNGTDDLNTSIKQVLAILKRETGLDAVGIRLQQGDDFPYFAQDGFSDDFLLKENSLIERTSDGGVCLNQDGTVSLECTCGLVLSGKTDPADPLCTPGGSCWTNDSTSLLEVPAEDDPRYQPRNTCIHLGYTSVALVPIRVGEKIVGLLHFNDRRQGCFSLEVIGYLEEVAHHIGSALLRKQSDDALKMSETQFKTLFDQLPVSIIIHDIETGEIINANAAAYASYGFISLEELQSAEIWSEPPFSAHEALEWIRKAAREGVQRFQWQSRTGDGEIFWEYVTLRPMIIQNVERVLAIAIDITESKKTEEQLKDKFRQIEMMNELMLEREKRVLEVKKEVNALCEALGRPQKYSSGMLD